MTPKNKSPRRPATQTARKRFRLLATLPVGRRRVAQALLAAGGRTYAAVARHLHFHLGTVYQHLRRIRLRHPLVYAALRQERTWQLANRHQQALARDALHTFQWEQIKERRRRPKVSISPYRVGSRAWTEWLQAKMNRPVPDTDTLDLSEPDLDLSHNWDLDQLSMRIDYPRILPEPQKPKPHRSPRRPRGT